MSTYTAKSKRVYDFIGTLSKESPAVAQGFVATHKAAGENGVLSAKEKELIAVGISIAIRCEGCIACHVGAALESGATKEDIIETIGVSVMMGGGPAVTYGQKAYEALEEYSAK